MYDITILNKVKQHVKQLYKVSYDTSNTSTIENVRLYIDENDSGSMFVAYKSKWQDSEYISHEEDMVICFNQKGELVDCCKKYNLCGVGVVDFLSSKKQINL